MSTEVKGSFFVSVRASLEPRDPVGLRSVIAAMPPEYRDALADPLASGWYPEAALGAMFSAVHRTIANGNRASFMKHMEDFTEVGLGKFFRVILRVSSPRFVVRQLPMIWRQLRRGGGQVEAVESDSSIELRYSDFPQFSDPLYEVGTVASVRALVRVCAGSDVPVTVSSRPADGLWLRIEA